MTGGVVEEYWSGVARRLQVEVDVFNGLVNHSGERGRENELALTRVLDRLLPPKWSIGSGIIFDKFGSRSQQTDLVVYNSHDQPKLMAQTNQVLFPIEMVYLAIEVKTTVDSAAVEDFAEKRASLQTLVPSNGYPAPQFALFGYQFSGAPVSVCRNILSTPAEARPHSVCVMNPGVFGSEPADGENFTIGLVPLHAVDETGQRIAGKWLKPPDGAADLAVIDGQNYPVVRTEPYGNVRVCGDPGRALLLFCIDLIRRLNNDMHPSWIQGYLHQTASEILVIGPTVTTGTARGPGGGETC